MKILLLFLLPIAHPAAAQSELRLQGHVAALRTHLLNASDNASGIVDSRPQITPNGGLTFSRVNNTKSGFQGFQIGLEYLSYKQTTSAESTDLTDPRKLKVTTGAHLHYLSIPVEARFGIATKSRIKPFATAGAYISQLFFYKETMHVRVQESAPNDYSTRNFTITNRNISTSGVYQNLPIDFGGEAEFSKWIYRSFDWGVMASLGADFEIGKNHFLSVRIPVRYYLGNVERKETLELKDKKGLVTPFLPSRNYWSYNTPKGLGLYQNTNSHSDRSATHLFSYGLEIAYGFRLL